MKEILINLTARQKLLTGAQKLSNVVKSTLGPKGRNVVLDRKYATPIITNDGVSIAREIEFEDKFENIGCKLLKEVCKKTNDDAGDGTTTAIVLAENLLENGLKHMDNNSFSPILLNVGINKAKDCAIKILKKMSKPVKNAQDIENIASISSQDKEIGKLIAKAYMYNKNCNISLEDSKTNKTELVFQEGLTLKSGLLSPYLATNIDKGVAELENPYVLLTDKKLTSFNELLNIYEQLLKVNRPLLIICDDIDEEVLSTIIVNKMRGTLNTCVIKAPFYAEKRLAVLEDIAVLANCEVLSSSKGNSLQDLTLNDLGEFKFVKITKDDSIIIAKNIENARLKNRQKLIKEQIDSCQNDYDKEQLKKRLSNLTGGIASILVGADSDIEQKEKKLRIEDALSATNSALSLGVLPGGGISLYKVSKILARKKIKLKTKEEKIGFNLVLASMQEPLKQIIKNAGLTPTTILNKLNNKKSQNYGYDALNDKFCNLLKCGIIDPTKVQICALQNACSVVTTMLTTEALVTSSDEN